MALRIFLAAAAALSSSSALAQQAAWDTAARYVCRAEAIRICRAGEPACSSTNGRGIFLVDFAAGTFRPYNSPPEASERIIHKRHQTFPSVAAIHVAVLSGGARMLQFHGARETGALEGSGLNAVFVDVHGGDVYTHSLFCAEQP